MSDSPRCFVWPSSTPASEATDLASHDAVGDNTDGCLLE